MPSLFSLFVDLKANTADFVSGMSTASYAAKKAGRDIEDSFSSLGSIATAVLAPFGELGAAIGETLSHIGEYASTASEHFAKLGGGMSAISVAAGTAAGAMAAVGAGAIGVALHAAESAASLAHLAQSTGVSIETLSRFGFAARQSGVDAETMDSALERMSRSSFAAATAPTGAISAYSRLGVSVRDSAGEIRPVGDILLDVASKFASMPDGVTKSALAMQIFGRSGDALIPMLNHGSEGLEELTAEADRLGVTINSTTGAAALRLEENFGIMKGAAEGAANALLDSLVPALLAVTKALADDTSAAKDNARGIAQFAVGTIDVLQTWWTWLKEIWTVTKALSDETLALGAVMSGFDVKGGLKQMAATYREANAELQKLQENNQKFIEQTAPLPARAPWTLPPSSNRGADTKQPQISGIAPTDPIKDLVKDLTDQASAQLVLASAIQQTVAAMTLEKAAGEAQIKIDKEREQLQNKSDTLNQQLKDAQKSAHPEEAGKFTTEIAAVQAQLQELDRDAPLIRQRYQEIASAKLFASTGEDLSKEGFRSDAEVDSLNRVVEAYKQGGSAIAAVDISKGIEGATQKVADLAETYARFAAENPFDIPALASLGEGLLSADAELKKIAADATAKHDLSIFEEIGKQTRALEGESEAYKLVAAAAFSSAAAQREAAAQAEVAKFKVEHPLSPTADQNTQASYNEGLETVHDNALQKLNQQYDLTIRQEAAQDDLNHSYDQEMAKLADVKEVLQGIGASTLSVDAAIYDANQKNIEQWDQMALKVGSVTDKFHEFANQIELEGQNLGEKIFSSMSKAVDDVSTQLAKFVVTGKSNFKQLFESLEESVAKAGFQRVFAGITKAVAGGPGTGQGSVGPGGTAGIIPGPVTDFFKKIGVNTGIPKLPVPGAAAQAGGTSANPFYVIPVDAQGNALSDSNGKSAGSASIISSLVNKPQTPGAAQNASPFPDLLKQLGAPNIPAPSSDSSGGGPVTDFLSSVGANTGIPNLPPPSGSSGSSSNAVAGGLSSISSAIGSAIGGTTGSLVSGLGKLIKPIFSLFGGFLAGGGDVTPGKAYVVGEKHPEFFVPGQSGTVAPSLKMSNAGHTVNNHIYIQGVQDFDSFARSDAQVMARIHQATALALSRNG